MRGCVFVIKWYSTTSWPVWRMARQSQAHPVVICFWDVGWPLYHHMHRVVLFHKFMQLQVHHSLQWIIIFGFDRKFQHFPTGAMFSVPAGGRYIPFGTHREYVKQWVWYLIRIGQSMCPSHILRPSPFRGSSSFIPVSTHFLCNTRLRPLYRHFSLHQLSCRPPIQTGLP